MGNSFSATFKKIYNEVLEPMGFIKMKGANHYFLRLIGDEILQIITYKKESPRYLKTKAFSIYCGMVTVYGGKAFVHRGGHVTPPPIDLKTYPQMNFNWLSHLGYLYGLINKGTHGDRLWQNLYSITYTEDTASMQSAIEYTLENVKQIALPQFNKVTDIESALEFFRKSCKNIVGDLYFPTEENDLSSDKNIMRRFGETILFVKTEYRGDFMELVQSREEFEFVKAQFTERGIQHPEYKVEYDEYYQKHFDWAKNRRVALDRILDNPDKLADFQTELEQRKAASIEILRGYGFKL